MKSLSSPSGMSLRQLFGDRSVDSMAPLQQVVFVSPLKCSHLTNAISRSRSINEAGDIRSPRDSNFNLSALGFEMEDNPSAEEAQRALAGQKIESPMHSEKLEVRVIDRLDPNNCSVQRTLFADLSQRIPSKEDYVHEGIDSRSLFYYDQCQESRLVRVPYLDLRYRAYPRNFVGDFGINTVYQVTLGPSIESQSNYLVVQTAMGDVDHRARKTHSVSQVAIPNNALGWLVHNIDNIMELADFSEPGELYEAFGQFGEDWFYLRNRLTAPGNVEVCSNHPVVGTSGSLSRFNITRHQLSLLTEMVRNLDPNQLIREARPALSRTQSHLSFDSPMEQKTLKEWFYRQRFEENERLSHYRAGSSGIF